MSALVVGVGARRGAPPEEVLGLIRAVLREAGEGAGPVVALATVDVKADDPGIAGAAAALGVPVRTHTARELAAVAVPHPSGAARDAVGTPSVAEAAALAGGGELLVPKRKSGTEGRPGRVTCAIVRLPDAPVPESAVCRATGSGTKPAPPTGDTARAPARRGSGDAGHDRNWQHRHRRPAPEENV
ncbi:cobalamin biosynthesis protein [Streptomyces sp. NPDC057445]|uniref:cobalamin biosynthesis protein n=1 Tax=Streptomyces sp. NPDC057445 TaxID=3346136 RepID=UPI003684F6EC